MQPPVRIVDLDISRSDPMNPTDRLSFLPTFGPSAALPEQLDEVHANCFAGPQKLAHMNEFSPIPVPSRAGVIQRFLGLGEIKQGYRAWIIRRTSEQDIIGFLIHGDFFPGLPNSIGFNIGLPYVRQGYGREALKALCAKLEADGFREFNGYCLDTNTASRRTMENAGFSLKGSPRNPRLNAHELHYIYRCQ